MKIGDLKVGARVLWRGNGGTVVYVQPVDARDARDVWSDAAGAVSRDFVDRFAEDERERRATSNHHGLTVPRGRVSVDLRRPRVMVRLDRLNDHPDFLPLPSDSLQHVREDHEYVWATPRTLLPHDDEIVRRYKLSPAMLRMLRAGERHGDVTWHLSGRAHHGGATGTIYALRSMGLIFNRQITEAGRRALADAERDR